VARQAAGVLGILLRTTGCHGRMKKNRDDLCEGVQYVESRIIEDEGLSRRFGHEEWE
jgi:hypothetical protein